MTADDDAERAADGVAYDKAWATFQRRHAISEAQVVAAVQWIERHRAWSESMKHAAMLAVIGILASALLLALWEGFKVTAR